VTSCWYVVIPVVLLPAPYLIFMPSVALSPDGAPRVSSAVDGVMQVVRRMSDGQNMISYLSKQPPETFRV
jgi:hypothetical protein